MYVIVRYGERQQEIFNPNCKTTALLKSIREKCSCGGDSEADDIELSDESGNIKYLREAQNRYASELLGERETLVLLKVDGPENPCPRYTPLLNDEDAITEEFLARLVVKDETDSRPESWKKKGRGTSSTDKDRHNKEKLNKEKTKQKPEKPVRSRSRQAREQ